MPDRLTFKLLRLLRVFRTCAPDGHIPCCKKSRARAVHSTPAGPPDHTFRWGRCVKQWQETSDILSRIAALAQRGEQAAVATVVQIKGSAYRRPGAKMLVEASGTTLGGVSGGCLEADVREVGLAVMRDNTPRLRHYDTGSDDTKVWGLGLGCNGSVDIFVQPATSQEALQVSRRVQELLKGDVPFAVSTVVTEQHDEEEPIGTGQTLVLVDGTVVTGSTGDAELEREIGRRAAECLAEGQSALYDISSTRVFTEVLPGHAGGTVARGRCRV